MERDTYKKLATRQHRLITSLRAALEEEKKSNHLSHEAMRTAEDRGVQKGREEMRAALEKAEKDQTDFADWVSIRYYLIPQLGRYAERTTPKEHVPHFSIKELLEFFKKRE